MTKVDSAMWTAADERSLSRLLAAIAADDLAAALLAVEGASEDEAAHALGWLESWARELRDSLGHSGSSPHAAAAGLYSVLVEGANFTGDATDYYAPRNSAFTEVVRRRSGQPILLSSVWMVVGQRAGLDVVGVGLPGHFIVRVGGVDGVLVDPFGAGRALVESDCADIVSQLSGGALPWERCYLTAASTGAIIERVLRNLIHACNRGRRRRRLYRAVRMLATLREGDPGATLLHARLAEDLGAVCLAQQLYEGIAARFPGTCECTVARRRLADVTDAATRLH